MSEVGLTSLITVAEAIALLDATPVAPRTEQIALKDADSRVLAAAISADRDYPPFDKSVMDGFAIRSADIGPRRVLGEIAAGQTGDRPLRAGECIAIMTGAPLPAGADAVVPVERTDVKDGLMTFDGDASPGDAMAKRGMESAADDLLLPIGTRLGAAQIATAAQVGASRVTVFAKPRVGVLSTGDEVVPFDQEPAGPQVRNGNSPMLAALLRRFGCEPIDLGHSPDEPARIASNICMPGLDAVVVTGGMSMGTRDFTPRVLRELGYNIRIAKLKMRPGKPFVFATRGGGVRAAPLGDASVDEAVLSAALRAAANTAPADRAGGDPPPIVFGLPGNPVSAFVCVMRLASRLLVRMAGAPSGESAQVWLWAKLLQPLPANGPREFYQPAVLVDGVVRPLKWRGSADLFTLARANVLMVRKAGDGPLAAGDAVHCLEIPQ